MARSPRLDRELERYLVEGEKVIVAVRLHWFHLAREILLAVAAIRVVMTAIAGTTAVMTAVEMIVVTDEETTATTVAILRNL